MMCEAVSDGVTSSHADPKNASIEVYNLVEGRYKLVPYAASEGTIESQVLPGLGLKMEEVFG